MIILPPLVAEMLPGILGIAVAVAGWFTAKHAHDQGQKHKG